MRAALYARVSTEDQAKNYSIPTQLEAMRNFVIEHGFEMVKEFTDEGISGATLDRPALGELREYAAQNMVDVILVYDPDRLSRKLVHLMVLADEFERAGIKLNFVTQSMGQTPEDKMLFGMKGLFAEYERTKLLERTTRGKMRKARAGKQPSGTAPYGYRLTGGKHELEPQETEVVRMIFDWLANEGMSLRAIQLRLNRLGIPTRQGKSWWQRATLYRIVRDPVYKGQWYYNKRAKAPAKTKKGATVQVLKPVEQWIPIEVPAVVSEETFESAQRQLEKNRESCRRNTRRQYLLTGLLVCGKCGFKLNARTIKNKVYYCCNSKLGTISPNICPSRYIQGSNLETIIWEAMSKLLTQPQLIVQQLENCHYSPHAHLEASLDRVCHALDRKKVEEDRMLQAYRIGAIELETLKCKMDEIRDEQRSLTEEKMRLEKELGRAKAQELNKEKLEQFCQSLPTNLANLDFADKKEIMREVTDRIVVDGAEVTIYGIIPTPRDVTIELPSSSILYFLD